MIQKPLEAFYFRDWNNAHIPEILEEVYRKNIYSPYLAGKVDTIVDFGANIGLTAYYFKDFAKKVYAVEPSKMHLEALNKMIAFNKIDNIKVCPVALSNRNGSTRFYHNPNVTAFSLTNQGQDDFEEVETVTIERFMKQENIDHINFAEIDIEGEEAKLFASEEFKRVCPKIDSFVFEYHDWSGVNPKNITDNLEDLGYQIRRIPAQAIIFGCTRI